MGGRESTVRYDRFWSGRGPAAGTPMEMDERRRWWDFALRSLKEEVEATPVSCEDASLENLLEEAGEDQAGIRKGHTGNQHARRFPLVGGRGFGGRTPRQGGELLLGQYGPGVQAGRIGAASGFRVCVCVDTEEGAAGGGKEGREDGWERQCCARVRVEKVSVPCLKFRGLRLLVLR